jgi:tetratricopeptide (TPR) repeat protein
MREAIQRDERGDIDGALELLASAENLSPDYAEVISLKGFLLSRKGEFDEGIRLMEMAIGMSPGRKNLSKMLNNLGVAYFNKKDYRNAVDRFERALAAATESDAHSPRVTNTLINLGNAYLGFGDCDNAIDRIERSLKSSYNLQTVRKMCFAYEKCGYPGRAADELEKAIKDLPNLDPDFVASSRKRIKKLRADEAEMGRDQPGTP